MEQFIEKLIGRLEEAVIVYPSGYGCMSYGVRAVPISEVKKIVNQLAEEHKDNVMIDGQYCWQTCGATEHCKECNRLCNGSIDYYENYDFMAEEPQWKRAMMNTFLKR